MELDFITQNSIIYVLIAWVIIVVIAKGLKLEKYGFELKAYSLVYKNKEVNSVLIKLLGRTKRGIRVFADVSVIAGFLMMGFAFWFLLNNVSNFFVEQSEFNAINSTYSRSNINILHHQLRTFCYQFQLYWLFMKVHTE